MKKVALFLGLSAVLLLTSCRKETTCRCSVIGDNAIRTLVIDKGACRDIRFIYSDHDGIHTDITDSLICTDYQFKH
ncbi:MAG: hypothetical protein MJZ81_05495 [Bacteroidales bacterium]|nr:hypothetical protein [Bacteroidales bacterium]